ncbi:MAG: hypothetical protein OEM43_07730 [Gammaproteobacteria bacterium]|nr:hypothetical protein [Gammaproteobacteria bacterium]
MSELICPFSATLVQEDFGCPKANPIVRRGGAEIACTTEQAHTRCKHLFQKLKDAALPEFGVEDDLLKMPHSVLVKVQYGGLLGLQRSMDPSTGPALAVDAIDSLVAAAIERFGSVDAIPCADFCDTIVNYKLPGRRKRSKQ